MDRIRDFLTRTGENDDDYDDNIAGNDRNYDRGTSSSSGNSGRQAGKFSYLKNAIQRDNAKNNSNLSPYLEDDDDWGMGALSAAKSSLKDERYAMMAQEFGVGDANRESDRYGPGEAKRRGSSGIFWDQGGRDNAGGVMTTSTSEEYMQEWEREAILRDNLDDAFEIGNDDYYHSDSFADGERSSNPSSRNESSHSSNSNSNAYREVEEDIRQVEEEEEEMAGAASDDGSNSGNKEEVVNAYRDYLKSIRDGGFESYLNHEVEEDTTDFSDILHTTAGASSGAGSSLNASSEMENKGKKKEISIEEEDHGSLYRDIYGVRDVRASRSPYATWRANGMGMGKNMRQPQFSQYDDDLEGSMKNLREGMKSAGTHQRSNSNGNNVMSNIKEKASDVKYHYKNTLVHHPRFKKVCVSLSILLALVIGLSYYGTQPSEEEETSSSSGLSVPPKDSGNDNTNVSNTPQPQQNDNAIPHDAPDAITNALLTFDPIWFDRVSGWEGITFSDAVNFCASHFSDPSSNDPSSPRIPCPYEIYCNQGSSGIPYKGVRGNGEQWAAISNGPNQWVQVGTMFTCQRYTDLHDKKKPEWGITGISMEHEHGAGGITQNLMCCRDANHLGPVEGWREQDTVENAVTEMGKQDAVENKEEDASIETTDSNLVKVEDEVQEKDVPSDGNMAVISNNVNIQKREKAVIAAFQPIWFSSAHGWAGTTYEDAVLFCEEYNHMVLCPFAAYCPNGPGHPALPGSMVLDLDGEEWAPANGPMNTWVQIGTLDGDEDTRCTLHHEILGERPEWGTDGTRQEVKHHILCCLM